MPGIGVVTNPRSRQNRKDPGGMQRLGYLLGSRGEAAATRSLDDLYRVAEEFKGAAIDVLGINGGDGTLHHTLTAFLRVYGERPLPKIAILRGGTMNTVANSFGIRGEPSALLFELLDRYHREEPFDLFEKEILDVGGAYGFIFGTGLVHNFLAAYYSTGRPSPSTAARLLGRAALSAIVSGPLAKSLTARFRARVTVDGDLWACDDFVTVTAAVVEQLGLGFRPFYRANEKPHTFPLLGIITPQPTDILAELPRLYRGRPMRRDKVIDCLARHVLFECDDEVRYIIDGDTYATKQRLEVKIGPRLTFIRLSGQVA